MKDLKLTFSQWLLALNKGEFIYGIGPKPIGYSFTKEPPSIANLIFHFGKKC